MAIEGIAGKSLLNKYIILSRTGLRDGMTPRSGRLEGVPNQGGTEDMDVEDEQEQDVFFNEEDEPEVGNNEMTADALYRKLSEFST